MQQLSVEDTLKIYDEAKARVPRRRDIDGPFDYGDDLSVGCCLKSVNPSSPEQFGVFVGQYDLRFVVLVSDVMGKCLGGEAFETAIEMYERWEID
jgi:hypothetical protein